MFEQDQNELPPMLGKHGYGPSSEPAEKQESAEYPLDEANIDWLRRAKDAYGFSTNYLDENVRKELNDSIRAFNNEHPSDSKYLKEQFAKRSKIYRPKTRAIINKHTAAAAAAFFSNSDNVSIIAQDPTNKEEADDAAIMKEIIEYRLEKTIPWYQIVLGGIQDAQVTGLACAHVHWITTLTADQKSIDQDKPNIDLIPIENLRFDPGASWIDPVGTSPYIIHLMPMFVCDVKERIKSGEWLPVSPGMIKSATKDIDDSIKINRHAKTPSDASMISDYEMVTVQRHIHRVNGIDYDFYTLSDRAMLSEPRPLSETVFHGERPYVIGKFNLETHRVFPSSVPTLSKGIQEEANNLASIRMDNVLLALNKRFITKRGKQIDYRSLVSNLPGSITQVDDLADIQELNFPDVTASSFAEQDRLNADMDELLGNFTGMNNPAGKGQMLDTARGAELLNGAANVIVEMNLRTYTETFIEPILRQLVKLEKHYETDEMILALCGRRAKKMLDKQGNVQQKSNEEALSNAGFTGMTQEEKPEEMPKISKNTDLTLRVNVGMGATNPSQRIQKIGLGMSTLQSLMGPSFMQMVNVEEVTKEIFGALGFGDGSRFIKSTDESPEVTQLKQQVMTLQKQLQDKMIPHQVKMQIANQDNQVKLAIAANREKNMNARKLVDHLHSISSLGLSNVARAGAIKTIENSQDPKQQVPSLGQAVKPPVSPTIPKP